MSMITDMNRLDDETDIARINTESGRASNTMQSALQINASMELNNALSLSNNENKQ